MPIDLDRLMSTMQRWTRDIEAQNREVEAMLDELNPRWREEEQERKAEAQAQRLSRRKSKAPVPPTPPENSTMPKSNLVDPDVMVVLRSAHCIGNKLYLPPKQLERNLYERTNEVLDRLGGKWKGGKTRAHLFEDDPAPLLAEVLATGIMPLDNPLDFYRTPDAVIDQMLERIQGIPDYILEPSAGDGAIVQALLARFPDAQIDAVEIDPKRADKLRQLGPRVNVIEGDFLSHWGDDYSAIVMNPPFAVENDKLAYATHIAHALTLLKPGGQLVSIAPAGLKYRTDRRTASLRHLLTRDGGTITDLDSGAFESAGTLVSTVMVCTSTSVFTFDKPTSAPSTTIQRITLPTAQLELL